MTSQLRDPLRAQNDDSELESKIIEGCKEGLSLENDPLGYGVDTQRGHEAVLWLAMELVYIDSANAQIRRYAYKKHRGCRFSVLYMQESYVRGTQQVQ